jgi:hypothetical protein
MKRASGWPGTNGLAGHWHGTARVRVTGAVPRLCLRLGGQARHDPFQIHVGPGLVSAGTKPAGPGPGWLGGQI